MFTYPKSIANSVDRQPTGEHCVESGNGLVANVAAGCACVGALVHMCIRVCRHCMMRCLSNDAGMQAQERGRARVDGKACATGVSFIRLVGDWPTPLVRLLGQTNNDKVYFAISKVMNS